MGTELQREVNRTRVARMTCQSRIEILELRDLGALPLLFAEELGSIGLGVSVQEGEKGPRLVVVLVAEAAPKRTLVCR
jgi:hypothetical protein